MSLNSITQTITHVDTCMEVCRVASSATHLHLQTSQHWTRQSQVEDLLQNPDGVLWALDGMTRRPGILIYLIVITTLKALIAEEVDRLVVDTGKVLGRISFSPDVLQAVCLVPTLREDIEGDLAADGVAGYD